MQQMCCKHLPSQLYRPHVQVEERMAHTTHAISTRFRLPTHYISYQSPMEPWLLCYS
jgi:hypothetical protein